MIYAYQVLYSAICIASTVLDYFIYRAFVRDIHHSLYLDISEYTDIGEGVLSIIMLLIGLIVEMGVIKTNTQKSTWKTIVVIIFVVISLESIARVTAMTIVSIHIHPGKIDFMGLFVMMTLEYYIVKFAAVLQFNMGLLDKIEAIKPSVNEFTPYPYFMPYQALSTSEPYSVQNNPIVQVEPKREDQKYPVLTDLNEAPSAKKVLVTQYYLP